MMTKLFDDGIITAPILQSPSSKLVYLPTLKCASSYYVKTFQQHDWQEITIHDIDWNTQTVFGFLIHPTARYAKGAATDMFDVGIENLIMTYIGARFWEYPPIFGVHTIPITEMYKKVYNDVNWIILDDNCVGNIQSLLNESGDTVIFPQEKENVSSDHQRQIYQKIEKLVAGPGESWYNMLYPEEIELYNRVKSNDTK